MPATETAGDMILRPERAADGQAIADCITAAFLTAEHSDGNEAAIVAALRDADALAISLVAETDAGQVVGHIAFSPVTIDGANEGWFGLGPVAVLPDWQGRGIGSALVNAGLAQLRAGGACGCVLLGDPGFYGRFGFVPDPALCLPGVPPEYFQRLILSGAPPAGEVAYHAAFGAG